MMAVEYLNTLGQDWYHALQKMLADPISHPVPSTLTITAGTLGAWLLWRKWSNRNRKLPPSPRGWPVIGNVLDLSEQDMHLDLLRLQKENNLPDIFTLNIGPSYKMIVLNSYSAIKDAFVSQGDLFAERPPLIGFEALGMKDDIFTKSYLDPTWREGKMFITSALRSAGFGSSKSAEEKILEHVNILIEHLDPKAMRAEPIDITDTMIKSASSVILGLLFGKMYALEDPELSRRVKSITDWYAGQKGAFVLEFFSVWFVKTFFKGMLRRLGKLTDECTSFVKQEIEEHIATLDAEHPRDFIDIYLARKKELLDKDLLANTTFVVMPDSMHTVGSQMSWAILYVTSHPNVLHRIWKEIDDVTSGSRYVTWSDRAKLPYTEATIMEAFRMSCPSVATGFHSAIRDCHYRGHFIPAGVPIMGNLYAAMMDPDNFKEPELFNPDRFLDKDGSLLKTDTWIPFGMGRRKCLGEQTTKIEVFLFVTNLFQRYDFRFSDDNSKPSLEPMSDVVTRIPRPYKVVLTSRA